MSHGFPKGAGAGVGKLGVLVKDHVPDSTDYKQLTPPGICINAASGQVNVLTTEEMK